MTEHHSITRRDVLRWCSAAPLAAWTAAIGFDARADAWGGALAETPPALAPGAPTSAERMALIEAFRRDSVGVEERFEKRTHGGAWAMPYRLFRPAGTGKLPLVLYLHGSGGLGDDNQKQLGLGNVFGTLSWALPDHQRRFPCYVLAPQTDRGWAKYQETSSGPARVAPGFGEGARTALEIVRALARELPIDERRLYVTGQSMGGAGVWNLLAHEPHAFAAAIACCGSATPDDVKPITHLPLWNFHGDADKTVPVAISRERIAALRKAGGQPIDTEYAGVDHNVWEWAYTEPALPEWLFSQRRT
jgi:predicted peptidase